MHIRNLNRVAIVLLVAALSACAQVKIAPPSAEIRAQIAAASVATSGSVKPEPPTAPVKGAGEGAALGAAEGAAAPGASIARGTCYGSDCIIGLAVAIALAPVGAIIGSVVGASKAHSAEDVDRAESAFARALADMEANAMLRDAVIAEGSEVPAVRLSAATGDTGGSAESSSEAGPSGVLMLTITEFKIVNLGRIDPDISIEIAASAQILRATDGTELYKRAWLHASKPRNYFTLAGDDAKGLRDDIRESFRVLAHQMVQDIFVATEPAPKHVEDQPVEPGTVVTTDGPAATNETRRAPGPINRPIFGQP